MPEKVIIEDATEKVEVIIEPVQPQAEEEVTEEWEVEFTSNSEYIQAAATAMSSVDHIDTALLTKADENRVRRIKRQGLRIISECLNELYEEIFDDNSDSTD